MGGSRRSRERKQEIMRVEDHVGGSRAVVSLDLKTNPPAFRARDKKELEKEETGVEGRGTE